MIGKLLSTAVQIAALPVRATNAAADVIMGAGDGSKRSRKQSDNPLSMLEDIADGVSEACEEIDKEGGAK